MASTFSLSLINCMKDRIFIEGTTARFKWWHLEAWNLKSWLVVFKHSHWNSPQSAEWQTCGDSKPWIFWWFYSYGITLYFIWVTEVYISPFESVLQTLKIIYNIIGKSECKGSYMFCNFFVRNSQISHFGHLPLTLKSPPINVDHHLCFILISPYFIAMFHLEMLSFPYLKM